MGVYIKVHLCCCCLFVAGTFVASYQTANTCIIESPMLTYTPHISYTYIRVSPTGRWKGVLVAVKIVGHRAAAKRTEGGAARGDPQRESLLSSSMMHPNVVWCVCVCIVCDFDVG